MLRFNNDYSNTAHDRVLEALQMTRNESFGGYGLDRYTELAEEEIKKYLDKPEAKIYLLTGGTQTNFITIAALLRPFQSVISADTGHIHVHETGAVEHTGHKVIALPNQDGKITAAQIEEVALSYKESDIKEHLTKPKLVYLSFPTELGTLYSKKELTEIKKVCDAYELSLFVDGARMNYGLAAEENDLSLSDFAALTDVFTCGGTKCGAMFGEALVINNPRFQEDFRSYMKQNGALLAKGWVPGVQFYALFRDGLYFEIAEKAVDYALRIKEAFQKKGISPYIDSPTNQQFFLLSEKHEKQLGATVLFEDAGKREGGRLIRLCTSWATKEEELKKLIGEIEKLS